MKKIVLLLLFLIPLSASAYVKEITKRLTVGSSFSVNPWSEGSSSFSGYTCISTYISGDRSAFTINETSRSSTTYTDYSGIQHGYSAWYSVVANSTGTYILYLGAQCIKSTATGHATGNPVVKCTVIVTPRVATTGITLDTSYAGITIGESLQLQATISPSNATNKNVTWSTSDKKIATVDDNGIVTGIGFGTCQIKATSKDNSSVVSSCTITVSNSLTINDATGCRGGISTVAVKMTNTEPVTAFQFEVVLPQNVTMSGCSLTGRKTDQTISYSKLANGNYQVTSLSATNTAFSGTEGTLANLKLSMADNIAKGKYTITIKNIELSTSSKAINPGNVSSTLTIKDVILGDTDGNGKVSIFDAVQVVNYILGANPAGFIEAGADMDDNGKITIFDAVSIVNIILNQTE